MALAVFALIHSRAFAQTRAGEIIESPIENTGNPTSLALTQNDLPQPVSLNLPAPDTLTGPAQVILIRHAEKPETGPDLNERGQERAQALVDFFKNNLAAARHGVPVEIYAAAPISEGSSLRSIETVTPLSQSLGIKINTNYTKKEDERMVKDIMSDSNCAGKTALICWEHKGIPDLLKDFGWTSGPNSWPGENVFDRVWILNFDGGKPVSFEDVPQHLLPGDSVN
jgi:hypothetical protein